MQLRQRLGRPVTLMKLTELEATFVGKYHEGTDPADSTSHDELDSVEGAQGVMFVCPECGNHSVLCWFKNPRNAPIVPDSAFPKPGRWTFTGETIETLTLAPSVDLSVGGVGCLWHGWVKNGDAR